jgi:hypothetical protein
MSSGDKIWDMQLIDPNCCISKQIQNLMNLRIICDSGMDETLVLIVLHGLLCHFFWKRIKKTEIQPKQHWFVDENCKTFGMST